MKRLALLCVLGVVFSAAQAAEMTEDQKVLYTLGAQVGQQLSNTFNLSPAELEYVKQGMSDSAAGKKPAVDVPAYAPKIQQLAQARAAARAEKAVADGKAYVEKAAKEAGAVSSDSGLVYISLKEGEGDSPAATDKVKVNYRGTFIDGREFDSSYKRNSPIEFPLDGVIKCWTEGVQKMKPGGKAKLVCPAGIAYGDKGAGPVPGGATLVFEVELLAVTKAAEADNAAADK
ncbi:MAG: FKBP-type peptidyl-prolyl cis-trans isomerase [Uliginosibacterium sp.]|nr:FKBP-type peptidyl-prolyl cis-trans isomerase [Uliginosibacterium sp.]